MCVCACVHISALGFTTWDGSLKSSPLLVTVHLASLTGVSESHTFTWTFKPLKDNLFLAQTCLGFPYRCLLPNTARVFQRCACVCICRCFLFSSWMYTVLTHTRMCGSTITSLRKRVLNIQNMWKRNQKKEDITWLLWPGCVWHPSFWNKQHLLRQTNAWKRKWEAYMIFMRNRHNLDFEI